MPWQSTGAGTLEFRRWPEQWLVFHPLSGSTHVLTEFAGLVLETLDAQAQPLSSAALLDAVMAGEDGDEAIDAGERAALEPALDEALASFQHLGLAEELRG